MIALDAEVLCAGNAVHDILVRPVEKLNFDQTVWVDDIAASLGGNGANTSYTLARLGVRVRLASIVGRDAAAEQVLQTLSAAGVDTREVARSEKPTSTTVVLVRQDGARAFFHRPGCTAEEFPIGFGGGGSHFHFGNVFALPAFRARGAAIMADARDAGFTTSLDAGWDARGEWSAVVDPMLPFTDLLFVNRDEARYLSGEPEAQGAARYFLGRGVKWVVVKLGSRGCAVYSGEGRSDVPGFVVQAVDSTGAGDCFAGGFLAALSRGYGMAESARFANAVGALNVQKLGAVGGVTGWDETLAWMSAAQAGHLRT